jgi:hypothetical protein
VRRRAFSLNCQTSKLIAGIDTFVSQLQDADGNRWLTREMIMRKTTILLAAIGIAVILALAAGCATGQTEDLLTKAGFKMMTATTPEQEAHLKTMPDHKLSMVQRNGKTFYVYPDIEQNRLYLGDTAEYQKYRAIIEQEKVKELEMNTDMLNGNSEAWGYWSP